MHLEIKLHSKFLLFSFKAKTFVFVNKYFSLNCKFSSELKDQIVTKASTKIRTFRMNLSILISLYKDLLIQMKSKLNVLLLYIVSQKKLVSSSCVYRYILKLQYIQFKYINHLLTTTSDVKRCNEAFYYKTPTLTKYE